MPSDPTRPTRRGGLDAVKQVRLHPAQVAWLNLRAAENEQSASELVRAAVWAEILRDPHAVEVVGEELLLDLVRDDPESFTEAPALQPLREPRLPTS